MRVFILAILLILSQQSFSQDPGFGKVDNYVDGLGLDKNISLDNLVSTLTKSFASPTLKTRAIYYWIAKNIQYDYEGYKTDYWKKYPSNLAILADTYKFRKGVCSGYSHLFKYMLTKAKIECEVIDGYARVGLETVIVAEPNHAWNAVKLNNKWYLFDVTWAFDTSTNKVDEFWFKTPPNLFILSHYPEQPNWTLLDENVNLPDFKNSPVYTKELIDMSIVKEFSKKGFYQAVDNIIIIDLKINKEYIWLTRLYDLEKGDWFSPTKVEDRAFEKGYIKLTTERKGKFILQLNAAKNIEGGFTISDDLVYFIIENK
jgi:hypothetical protein